MKDSWKKFDTVKVAAVQMDAYAEGRGKEMVEYIDRAGAEGAELIVFSEFILGAFFEDTNVVIEAVSRAADKNNIYVIAGGMDEYEQGAFEALKKAAFSNTA
jgi:predicted amidohydrolase